MVLQDQSTLGAYIIDGKNRIADPRYLHKYARLFDREIRKSGAKTVFFLTWARKDSMERDQPSLNYAYISIARELKALVAPVGIVWQRVRSANPNLALYIEDNSHPTSTGSMRLRVNSTLQSMARVPSGFLIRSLVIRLMMKATLTPKSRSRWSTFPPRMRS